MNKVSSVSIAFIMGWRKGLTEFCVSRLIFLSKKPKKMDRKVDGKSSILTSTWQLQIGYNYVLRSDPDQISDCRFRAGGAVQRPCPVLGSASPSPQFGLDSAAKGFICTTHSHTHTLDRSNRSKEGARHRQSASRQDGQHSNGRIRQPQPSVLLEAQSPHPRYKLTTNHVRHTLKLD